MRKNDWFTLLYHQNYDMLLRIAYRLTGRIETAQDLVQDTFTKALFQQKKLFHHPKPEAWLVVTLRNLIQNERRRFSAQECSLETVLHLSSPEPEPPLETMLPAQLSPEDRQILIWRFEQEIGYPEIANRLGISETGCRSRLSRAVARCRACLLLE